MWFWFSFFCAVFLVGVVGYWFVSRSFMEFEAEDIIKAYQLEEAKQQKTTKSNCCEKG